jgi:glycosyltransferase involved in cell wall biosynthesis
MLKISAIIPNFNHASFLPACIDAIIKQGDYVDEILIIDDASTDESLSVISSYVEKYTFIHLIKNPRNIGVHASINQALHYAKNSYVALCAADDYLLPGFFREASAMITKHPEIRLCFGDYCYFDTDKPDLFHPVRVISKCSKARIFTPDEVVSLASKSNFHVPSQVTLYHKDTLHHYRYNSNFKSLADFYLNFQIALRYPVGYIPSYFGAYRVVQKSYGNQIRRQMKTRMKLYSYWIERVKKVEDPMFRRHFTKAALFSFGGYFMLFYLFFHPKHWRMFPRMIYRVLLRKYFARIESSQKTISSQQLLQEKALIKASSEANDRSVHTV